MKVVAEQATEGVVFSPALVKMPMLRDSVGRYALPLPARQCLRSKLNFSVLSSYDHKARESVLVYRRV